MENMGISYLSHVLASDIPRPRVSAQPLTSISIDDSGCMILILMKEKALHKGGAPLVKDLG